MQCNRNVDTLASQWNSTPNGPNTATGDAEARGLETCAQRLQTCSCAALQAGDRMACGLASEPQTP
jgi:hypothetical protein